MATLSQHLPHLRARSLTTSLSSGPPSIYAARCFVVSATTAHPLLSAHAIHLQISSSIAVVSPLSCPLSPQSTMSFSPLARRLAPCWPEGPSVVRLPKPSNAQGLQELFPLNLSTTLLSEWCWTIFVQIAKFSPCGPFSPQPQRDFWPVFGGPRCLDNGLTAGCFLAISHKSTFACNESFVLVSHHAVFAQLKCGCGFWVRHFLSFFLCFFIVDVSDASIWWWHKTFCNLCLYINKNWGAENMCLWSLCDIPLCWPFVST